MITTGEWTIGEKIPSVNDLAEMFGVNRLTVRIVIQRLNALGVLCTKTGEGSFVQRFDFEALITDLSDFYYSPSVLQKVTDFRQAIERECIERVIRQDSVDLSELKRYCRLFENEVNRYYELSDDQDKEQSLKLSVQYSLAMQSELVRLADNELFLWSFSLAKALVSKHAMHHAFSRINEVGENRKNRWIQSHWDLFYSIKNKNETQAIEVLNQIIGSLEKMS